MHASLRGLSHGSMPGARRVGTLSRFCVLLALCCALLAGGCEHKAAKLTPAVLVPAIESAPEPAPEPQTVTTPQAVPAVPEPATATPSAQEAPKPRPKPRKPAVHKPAPPAVVEAPKPEQPAKPEAPQPEASHPSAPDNSVQITAAVPASAMQSRTQDTEQLLRSSKAKLEGVNRPLNDSERAMASQARNYIAQSGEAMQQGEIERAYNLAVKASLLADELSK